MPVLGTISAWLRNQNINVPDDWVAACIDFLKSENRNADDFSVLKKLVYEQWLLTDLSDLELQALPSEIKNEKYVLKGTYCLQINSLVDASQPKYSQLQKIQKKENTNTLVTADTQFTQKPWEAKPSRMLMLELTDGVTEVSGMEYNAIPKLNEKLPPGTKVRVKGPVTCRRGVLMLNQSNVEVLGGEVEDLFAENNYEAVLCKGLNRPVPAQPMPRDIQHAPANTITSNPTITDGATKNDTVSDISDEALDELMSDIDFEGEEATAPKEVVPCGRFSSSDDRKPKKAVVQPSATANDVIMIDSDLEDFLNDAENGDDTLPDFSPKPRNNSTATSSGGGSVRPDTGHLNMNTAGRPAADSGTSKSSSSSFSNSSLPTSTGTSSLVNQSKDIGNLGLKQQALPIRNDAKSSPPKTEPDTSSRFQPAPHAHIISKGACRSSAHTVQHDQAAYEAQSKPHSTASGRHTGEDINKVYICQAKRRLSSMQLGQIVCLSVKAVVITLLAKLKYDVLHGWSLGARICDGTDMLDIEFSNEVLENLIGFTVADAERVKLSGNAEDCDQLKEGIDNCRETIITMCHYMNIKMEKSGRNIVTDVKL